MALSRIFTLCQLFFAIFLVGAYGQDNEYREECFVWSKEIQRVQSEPRLEVQCKVNPQCTGFDCSGQYQYNSILTGNNPYEKDICFGLWINPCSKPTDLTVYIEQRSDNLSFTHNYKHSGNHTTDVPGFEEHITLPFIGNAGKVKVTVRTDIKHITIKGRPYMTIGLMIKPKLVTGGYDEYIDDMQVALVDDVDVPVPDCDSSVPLTTHKAHTCNVTVVKNETKCKNNEKKLCSLFGCKCVKQSLLGKQFFPSCQPDVMTYCQSLRYGGCIVHDDSKPPKYYCDCLFNRIKDDTCAPPNHNSSANPVYIITEPPPLSKPATSKKTVIVAVCSVVAIALALAATGFVVFKYHQHRSRYGNDQLISNVNEDDDDADVPPIDLET